MSTVRGYQGRAGFLTHCSSRPFILGESILWFGAFIDHRVIVRKNVLIYLVIQDVLVELVVGVEGRQPLLKCL